MSSYLYQLRTFQGEERSKEEEDKDKFKEAIKEYIDENHSEMKFDTFVQDYLSRRDGRREKLKDNFDGKSAEMRYEDYRRQNNNPVVEKYQLPYTKDNFDNILEDDQLWTGQDYSDNDISASEVFDQWLKKFDEKTLFELDDQLDDSRERIRNKVVNDRYNSDHLEVGQQNKIIGDIGNDQLSLFQPSSSGDVSQVSIKNHDETKALKRNPIKLFQNKNNINRKKYMEEEQDKYSRSSISSKDKTQKQFALFGDESDRIPSKTKPINLFPNHYLPEPYRRNRLDSNQASYLSSSSTPLKQPTKKENRIFDSDYSRRRKPTSPSNYERTSARSTMLDSYQEIFPNFQVNFNNGIARDWNFEEIWESKKSSNQVEDKSRVSSHENDNIDLFNTQQESAISNKDMNLKLNKSFSETYETVKPLYRSKHNPKYETYDFNERIRGNKIHHLQDPLKEDNHLNIQRSKQIIGKPNVTPTQTSPPHIFSQFPFSYQHNLEQSPTSSNWFSRNNAKENSLRNSFEYEDKMERNKLENLSMIELNANEVYSIEKGLHEVEINTNDKDPQEWNNFGNAWKPIYAGTPNDQLHSMNNPKYSEDDGKRIQNNLNKVEIHPQIDTKSYYNNPIQYTPISENFPLVIDKVNPVNQKITIKGNGTNKRKVLRHSRRPRIRKRRPSKREKLVKSSNAINPSHTNSPQWRSISYHPKAGRPVRIETRVSGVKLGDWNSPVVDNLLKVRNNNLLMI